MRVILAAALAGCGGAGTPSPRAALVLPRDLTGCYALLAGAHLDVGALKIRLDSTPAPPELRPARRGTAWMAMRLDADGRVVPQEGGWPKLSWYPHPPSDSVRILYGHGWGGAELTVHAQARGDTLRGRAVKINDHSPTYEDGGPATLIPIECAPPAASAASPSPGM